MQSDRQGLSVSVPVPTLFFDVFAPGGGRPLQNMHEEAAKPAPLLAF